MIAAAFVGRIRIGAAIRLRVRINGDSIKPELENPYVVGTDNHRRAGIDDHRLHHGDQVVAIITAEGVVTGTGTAGDCVCQA